MFFLNSIKFKFTLWYLAILAILLVALTGGVYLNLSRTLHNNLDESLKMRAEHLSGYRDIMSIVSSGTFEGEVGELISFYFYSRNRLRQISPGQFTIHLDEGLIKEALTGRELFSTVLSENGKTFRVYAKHFTPDQPQIRPEKYLPGSGEGQAPPRPEAGPSQPIPRTGQAPPRPEAGPSQPIPRTGQAPPRPGPGKAPPGPPPNRLEVTSAALVIARPNTDIEMALNGLLRILCIAVPLTLVLAGCGGVFLARRAFKPVDVITRIARDISESDLSRRIDVKTKDELGRLAATLNNMIERLEKAFMRQKQFTGDASHELRAPLSIIQAESTLTLNRDRTVGEYKKAVEAIAQEADHMAKIIDQLLTLARMDSGRNQLTFEDIEIVDFLKNICADVDILCREKELNFQLWTSEEIMVRGHRRSLRSLIMNLLENAIRYTDRGGSISVSVEKKDGMISIAVKDTGIGIPAEDLPLIFERFYRVDKARSRKMGGSGLGLAISLQIAELHGGSIEVQSVTDVGSQFTLKIPIQK